MKLSSQVSSVVVLYSYIDAFVSCLIRLNRFKHCSESSIRCLWFVTVSFQHLRLYGLYSKPYVSWRLGLTTNYFNLKKKNKIIRKIKTGRPVKFRLMCANTCSLFNIYFFCLNSSHCACVNFTFSFLHFYNFCAIISSIISSGLCIRALLC